MKIRHVAATLLPLACASNLALAQGTPIELKYASSAPPTSPWAKQVNRSVADVAEQTNGGIKITPLVVC